MHCSMAGVRATSRPVRTRRKNPARSAAPVRRQRRPSLTPFAYQKAAQARGCGQTRSVAARQRPEIQRVLDGPAAVKSGVRADRGRLQIPATEQSLRRADVGPCLQQVGGERVAEGVGRDELGDAGSSIDCANRVPEDALVEGWRVAAAAGRPVLSVIARESPPRLRARDRRVRAVEPPGQRGGAARAPMETRSESDGLLREG